MQKDRLYHRKRNQRFSLREKRSCELVASNEKIPCSSRAKFANIRLKESRYHRLAINSANFTHYLIQLSNVTNKYITYHVCENQEKRHAKLLSVFSTVQTFPSVREIKTLKNAWLFYAIDSGSRRSRVTKFSEPLTIG